MKRSISNIGWAPEYNETVYKMMQTFGFKGLEIAPTIWITEQPYETENREKAKQIATDIEKTYGFTVSSMQSIWFGRQELLFGTEEERESLLQYTKQAIDFASAIGCRNLVFGCPRNRNIMAEWNLSEQQINNIATRFFRELGEYALQRNTVLAMEANPPIYNTNYMNTTEQALELVHHVDSKGFLLNLDLGTMICNEESVTLLEGEIPYINHVHISEPGLKPVEKRAIHQELTDLLRRENYEKFISIEVGKSQPEELEQMMQYVTEVFYD